MISLLPSTELCLHTVALIRLVIFAVDVLTNLPVCKQNTCFSAVGGSRRGTAEDNLLKGGAAHMLQVFVVPPWLGQLWLKTIQRCSITMRC